MTKPKQKQRSVQLWLMCTVQCTLSYSCSCPEWLPPSGFFYPAPVRWLWNLWIQDSDWFQRLAWSPLKVLFEGCLGLLGEKVFPGIVYLHAVTGSVVPQIVRSVSLIFHWPHLAWPGVPAEHQWPLGKTSKSPRLSSFLGQQVQTQCHTQWKRGIQEESGTWQESLWQPLNSNVSEALPNTKSNPQPIRSYSVKRSHCDYNHICINSTYGHLLITLLHSICHMQK